MNIFHYVFIYDFFKRNLNFEFNHILQKPWIWKPHVANVGLLCDYMWKPQITLLLDNKNHNLSTSPCSYFSHDRRKLESARQFSRSWISLSSRENHVQCNTELVNYIKTKGNWSKTMYSILLITDQEAALARSNGSLCCPFSSSILAEASTALRGSGVKVPSGP